MRCLSLVIALLVCATVARADSLSDLRRPSSTIAGCVNDWGPLGDGSGVVEPTREAKAALAEWNEHAAAVNTARDTLLNASNWPDKADPRAVIDALNECAAAADAMARLYHPVQPRPRDFADVLAWMRPWFERQKLPIPAAIGSSFRTIAEALDRPNLLRQEKALYDQAAVFATRESELAAELGSDVQQQTDAAVQAAHVAALQAAPAAENGHAQPNAGAAIATAAGSGHHALAQEQARQLNQSLAAHPNQGGYAAQTGRALGAIPSAFLWIGTFTLFGIAVGFPRLAARLGMAGALEFPAPPGQPALSWLPLALLHAVTGWPDGWVAFLLWLVLFGILVTGGPRLLPGRVGRVWVSLFASPPFDTHGSARFGQMSDAAGLGHLAPSARADAFALGTIRGAGQKTDPRFWQDGHILTCAPTGAGKGIGAVIPNLLDYPGSVFVLDIKGENYAVTARARRETGQNVFLIDPFGMTGAAGKAMNWLDALNPDDPDVVSLSGALADMLVVGTGRESEPHWNDTAKELVYVAGLPLERRTMAELRRILTASEDDLAETLADMLVDPERGQRLPARAATAHLNRPERGARLGAIHRLAPHRLAG